jgi:hypothetical protein
MESGEPVTFNRLQKARTRIANSAPMDDKNGQRLVGIMKRQLDDFINGMALAPEQASAFEYAKSLRQAQGARFEQGANAPLSMRGDELGGQKIADSAIRATISPLGRGDMKAWTPSGVLWVAARTHKPQLRITSWALSCAERPTRTV